VTHSGTPCSHQCLAANRNYVCDFVVPKEFHTCGQTHCSDGNLSPSVAQRVSGWSTRQRGYLSYSHREKETNIYQAPRSGVGPGLCGLIQSSQPPCKGYYHSPALRMRYRKVQGFVQDHTVSKHKLRIPNQKSDICSTSSPNPFTPQPPSA
jgi:hypothetical protein